jgi:ribosome recycling factor
MSAAREHRKAAKKKVKHRDKKAAASSNTFSEAVEALGDVTCASFKQIADFTVKVRQSYSRTRPPPLRRASGWLV